MGKEKHKATTSSFLFLHHEHGNFRSWAFNVSIQNIKVVLKLSLFIHKKTALASFHTPHTTSELTLSSYVSGFCACEGHSAAAKTKQPLGLITKTDFSPKCRWELASFKEKNQSQEQLESQSKFPGQAAIPYFLTQIVQAQPHSFL